jgi:glycosyltransferase involved in cell wall biosynthesis
MGLSPLGAKNGSSGSILYASKSCTPHDIRFLKCLAKKFHRVYFLRFDGKKNRSEDKRIPIGVDQIDWIGTQVPLSNSNFLDFIRDLQRLEPSISVDAVVAGPIPTIGFICTQVLSTPTILMSWASDLLFDIHQSFEDLSRAQDAIRASAGIIVDSKTISSIAVDLGGDVANILICPWGIELEDFQPELPRIPDGTFRVLSLRSLEKIYDLETLIRSISILKKSGELFIKATIIGAGSEEKSLLELASTLEVTEQIDWLPPVPESAIAEVLHSHDLYVSTSRSDGSSISMLQALSTGQLVLVSDIPSNQEWVTDNWNGWLFQVSNPKSLAAKIAEIATCPTLDLIRSRAPVEVQMRADWMANQERVCQFIEERFQT